MIVMYILELEYHFKYTAVGLLHMGEVLGCQSSFTWNKMTVEDKLI